MPSATIMADVAFVDPHARLECKVCWYVYDPAMGDDVWQIAPGTPFAALPEHWACPRCATPRDQFLVLRDEESGHG